MSGHTPVVFQRSRRILVVAPDEVLMQLSKPLNMIFSSCYFHVNNAHCEWRAEVATTVNHFSSTSSSASTLKQVSVISTISSKLYGNCRHILFTLCSLFFCSLLNRGHRLSALAKFTNSFVIGDQCHKTHSHTGKNTHTHMPRGQIRQAKTIRAVTGCGPLRSESAPLSVASNGN